MAEETPAAADFTTEQVEAVAESIVQEGTRAQMLATLAALAGRLVKDLNGALNMHAVIEDPLMAVWGVVRVLSSHPIPETGGGTDGWGLTTAQVEKGELFCAFGTGATASCVVHFELPRRPRVTVGQRRPRGQAAALQNSTNARAGAHVAFTDANGDVLRGVILTMSLYVPSQGKNHAVLCGGQTVVFAFVFVAIRMSWAFVVTHRPSNPVPVVPIHPFRLPAEQTLYESLHTAVEGFPQAVVVDAEWVKCVHEAHAGKLAKDDLKAADKSYWHLTVTPTDTTNRNEEYGLSKEETEAWAGQVFNKWVSYFALFTPADDGEDDTPMDIAISGSTRLALLLQANAMHAHAMHAQGEEPPGPAWRQDGLRTCKEHLVQKLNWLDFLSHEPLQKEGGVEMVPSPRSKKPAGGSVVPQAPRRGQNQNQRSTLTLREALKQEDDSAFLESCIPGKGDLGVNSRMQLQRLLLLVDATPAQKVNDLLQSDQWLVWHRVATIVRDNVVPTPHWFASSPAHKEKFDAFVATLKQKYLPESRRWNDTQVQAAKDVCGRLFEERKAIADGGGGERAGGKRRASPDGRPRKSHKRGGGSKSHKQGGGSKHGLPTIAPRRLQPARPPPRRAPPAPVALGATALMDQIRQADAERILTEVRSVRADIMNKVSEVQAAVGHAQMDVVREVQQAATDANGTVPSPDVSLQHKLNIAKSAVKMLMQPFHSEQAGSSVRDKMKPYVDCAKMQAGQREIGFSQEEIEEMFGASL